ncbi:MAG: hypothetical protein IH987_08505, partial [Planctomycetes bacterium]|nr:hypothetical protein [Planctomycetota bacterium]
MIDALRAAQRASNRDRFEQAQNRLPTDGVDADLQPIITMLGEIPLVDEAGALDEADAALDAFRDDRRTLLE